MEIKISLLFMVMVIIKLNLIQKKLLNHLKNYVINLLILTNLMKSIINLCIMLQNLENVNMTIKVVFLQTKKKKKMERYDRNLGNIVDLYNLYNLKSGSDTIKKGEGLKILTSKQMLNPLPILLAQIQAENNSKSLKKEIRQILYSLYRSKVLTKTVYNNLIKSIYS